MEREVNDSVYIAFQLLLCALIIGAIAVSLFIGKSLVNAKQRDEIGVSMQQDNSQFYSYLNSTISGSDIVDLMVTYAKIYDFVVVGGNSNNVNVLYTKFEETDIEEFKPIKIREDLQSMRLLDKKYTMRLLLTPDKCQILGIVFEKEGANLDEAALKKLARDTLGITNYDVSIR